MCWRSILKESKQTSRQMANLNWKEEMVPEETEEDCLQWVKDFNGLIKKLNTIIVNDQNWYTAEYNPSQEHNEIVCKVISEIKKLVSEGEQFNEESWRKLGEERDWNSHLDTSKGISWMFTYYDGDGYLAQLVIGKDGKPIVDSVINGYGSEPFDVYFRTTLRSYDGKSGGPNPEYNGDKKRKEMNDIIIQINEHFQKIAPPVRKYRYDRIEAGGTG